MSFYKFKKLLGHANVGDSPESLEAKKEMGLIGAIASDYKISNVDEKELLSQLLDKRVKALSGKNRTNPAFPDELNTTEARTLLAKCVDAGWLDEHYQLLKLPKAFYSILAFQLDLILALHSPWKTFEKLWHVKYLRQTHNEAGKAAKKYDKHTAKIRSILK